MTDDYAITTRSEGLLGQIGLWGAALITHEELLEALAEHDAAKRAEWEAEGRRWYAACWRDDNGVLNSLESSTVTREYAEADVTRWRAAEAKEDGGQPDRVVLASKIAYPWVPVNENETTNREVCMCVDHLPPAGMPFPPCPIHWPTDREVGSPDPKETP